MPLETLSPLAAVLVAISLLVERVVACLSVVGNSKDGADFGRETHWKGRSGS
jgi:hypothetical protein